MTKEKPRKEETRKPPPKPFVLVMVYEGARLARFLQGRARFWKEHDFTVAEKLTKACSNVEERRFSRRVKRRQPNAGFSP